MQVKLLLIVPAAALLIAHGAYATSSPSGLRGTVTRGPITPACAAEQRCSEPAPNVTLVFLMGNRVTGRAITDSAGRYRIRLAPGRYVVSRTPQPPIGRGLQPEQARVFLGRVTRVDFSIDTGIR
jgi:hypothetical protein